MTTYTTVQEEAIACLNQPLQIIACAGSGKTQVISQRIAAILALPSVKPRNVIAFIHVSWLDPNKIRRTTIVGSKKMLVYDDLALQEKIRIYDKGVDVAPYYDTFGEFQFSYRYGNVMIPRIDEAEPLKLECEHFVDCICNGETPRTDGLSGLRVVSVLEAANLSLKNGGAMVPVSRPEV